MRKRLVAAILVVLALGGISTWLFAADHAGPLPEGDFAPRKTPTRVLTGSGADDERRALIARATTRVPAQPKPEPLPDLVVCQFLSDEPTGTSAKFDCVLDGGEVVKVKYGRNPEIHAETAATRLIRTLGFAADHVEIVPALRCFGCPRYPFFAMQLLTIAGAPSLVGERGLDGFTEFHDVSVERRFPAPSVETTDHQGWAWWELPVTSPLQGELDALRLLAVFLAHWDNKAENQRLVCLDDLPPEGGSHDNPGTTDVASGFSRKSCDKPLLMIQDAGATFGPSKLNLARWRGVPVWADRTTCAVSMRGLPRGGATFPDGYISEAGRALLAGAFARFGEDDVRALFSDARIDEFHSTIDDGKVMEAWTTAFRERVAEIVSAGPCPRRSSDLSD